MSVFFEKNHKNSLHGQTRVDVRYLNTVADFK